MSATSESASRAHDSFWQTTTGRCIALPSVQPVNGRNGCGPNGESRKKNRQYGSKQNIAPAGVERSNSNMGLSKRGNTWTIQFFANGKRVREAIGPSKRQAELVLAKRRADLREGRYFETQKEKPLAFSVLADHYLEEYAKEYSKPRSYQRKASVVKTLKAFFGNISAQGMTPEDV